MAEVRVRFAPSPTGMLHLGGARTALFNYLFARHHGGALVLRVEDTDRARSTREFEEAQLEDLAWLGLDFDEGPYRQSERGELYEEGIERLSEAGLTYESEDERGRRALYFRPPDREGTFRDELRGEVSFSRIEDFVIRKSDGTPSYNFAAVVDDAEMGITHVIRGEEHLPNTARQALLYRALGLAEPKFVHLGVILGPDGKKLSKRHGDASVADYRREGYLPEALVNYLALLGWTHPTGREEFADLDELVREWDPSRLGASPSTFDPDRLLYFDARHIRRLTDDELRRRVEPFLGGAVAGGTGRPPRWRWSGKRRGCSRTRRVCCGRSWNPWTPRAFLRGTAGVERGGLRPRGRIARRQGVAGRGSRAGFRRRAARLGQGAGHKDPRPAASPAAGADGPEQGTGDGARARGARARERRGRG